MNQELKQLQDREAKLVHQINEIAAWSGIGLCVGELLELKEVREKIATLQDKK